MTVGRKKWGWGLIINFWHPPSSTDRTMRAREIWVEDKNPPWLNTTICHRCDNLWPWAACSIQPRLVFAFHIVSSEKCQRREELPFNLKQLTHFLSRNVFALSCDPLAHRCSVSLYHQGYSFSAWDWNSVSNLSSITKKIIYCKSDATFPNFTLKHALHMLNILFSTPTDNSRWLSYNIILHPIIGSKGVLCNAIVQYH